MLRCVTEKCSCTFGWFTIHLKILRPSESYVFIEVCVFLVLFTGELFPNAETLLENLLSHGYKMSSIPSVAGATATPVVMSNVIESGATSSMQTVQQNTVHDPANQGSLLFHIYFRFSLSSSLTFLAVRVGHTMDYSFPLVPFSYLTLILLNLYLPVVKLFLICFIYLAFSTAFEVWIGLKGCVYYALLPFLLAGIYIINFMSDIVIF